MYKEGLGALSETTTARRWALGHVRIDGWSHPLAATYLAQERDSITIDPVLADRDACTCEGVK